MLRQIQWGSGSGGAGAAAAIAAAAKRARPSCLSSVRQWQWQWQWQRQQRQPPVSSSCFFSTSRLFDPIPPPPGVANSTPESQASDAADNDPADTATTSTTTQTEGGGTSSSSAATATFVPGQIDLGGGMSSPLDLSKIQLPPAGADIAVPKESQRLKEAEQKRTTKHSAAAAVATSSNLRKISLDDLFPGKDATSRTTNTTAQEATASTLVPDASPPPFRSASLPEVPRPHQGQGQEGQVDTGRNSALWRQASDLLQRGGDRNGTCMNGTTSQQEQQQQQKQPSPSLPPPPSLPPASTINTSTAAVATHTRTTSPPPPNFAGGPDAGTVGSSMPALPSMPSIFFKNAGSTTSDARGRADEHVPAKLTFHPITRESSPSDIKMTKRSKKRRIRRKKKAGRVVGRQPSTGGGGGRGKERSSSFSASVPDEDNVGSKDDREEEMVVEALPSHSEPNQRPTDGDNGDLAMIRGIRDGPSTKFGTGLIANLTDGTVLATSGRTVVLSTVVHDAPPKSCTKSRFAPVDDIDENAFSAASTAAAAAAMAAEEARQMSSLLKSTARKYTGMVPLIVDYRERYHGVGRIPTHTKTRRDNTRPTETETLASRAIDRALRPLLPRTEYVVDEEGRGEVAVTCSVQACDRSTASTTAADDEEERKDKQQRRSGDPIALAINAASAALVRSGLPFQGPVGAVRLALLHGGTVVLDPTPQELEDQSHLDLLLAGTRDGTLMIEFGCGAPRLVRDREGEDGGDVVGKGDDARYYASEEPGVPEEVVADMIRLAHASIQPIIEAQEEHLLAYATMRDDNDSINGIDNDDEYDDAALLAELGLPVQDALSDFCPPPSPPPAQQQQQPEGVFSNSVAERVLNEAFAFVSAKLGDIALRLFSPGDVLGESPDAAVPPPMILGAIVHTGKPPLLSKKVRGRREHIVREEVRRLLQQEFYVPSYSSSDTGESDNEGSDGSSRVRSAYRSLVARCDGAIDVLADATFERLLKQAMHDSATRLGSRGDGRGGPELIGLRAVRPVRATTPLLPDVVHGSALFSRGETQVLCTVTLGAPSEGLSVTNPYMPLNTFDLSAEKEKEKGPYDDLPVGSLRYLRSQMALESDLNSRKVKADREMTGDSGTLDEVRRAFLHYDFPAFSTGETQMGGTAVNRRAIGHGTLAEKSILPVLPPPGAFPYAIRVTSEVTGSNGSSSMASACGATLALLDAGVPITAPVAGVSVGLVAGEDCGSQSFGLLLDITGTEDHYGEMDFKIAGTNHGVTAMQLDVKRSLPIEVVIKAMQVAKEGRTAILDAMESQARETSVGIIEGLKPRQQLKATAPRVEIVRFDPLRKRDLVGPGGAVLKQLEDRFSVSLDLSQEGQCLLHGADAKIVSMAKAAVMDLVADVEEGGIYEGTVIEIHDFGAVVELLRNKEGLLHVSELEDEVKMKNHPEGNLGLVKEALAVGQKIQVVCTGVDPVQGSIKLSRKKLMHQELLARK